MYGDGIRGVRRRRRRRAASPAAALDIFQTDPIGSRLFIFYINPPNLENIGSIFCKKNKIKFTNETSPVFPCFRRRRRRPPSVAAQNPSSASFSLSLFKGDRGDSRPAPAARAPEASTRFNCSDVGDHPSPVRSRLEGRDSIASSRRPWDGKAGATSVLGAKRCCRF